MRHLGRIGFLFGDFVRRANLVLAGVTRHLEKLVRIEVAAGDRDGHATLAGLFVLSSLLFGFPLSCLFAFPLLLTPSPGVFFVLGLFQTFFFVALRLLFLPPPFFFLGPLLIGALRDRAPDGFGRLVPAFLTEIT
jgi:hypothetical protein